MLNSLKNEGVVNPVYISSAENDSFGNLSVESTLFLSLRLTESGFHALDIDESFDSNTGFVLINSMKEVIMELIIMAVIWAAVLNIAMPICVAIMEREAIEHDRAVERANQWESEWESYWQRERAAWEAERARESAEIP